MAESTMNLGYLIGEPGSGKTTLLNAATAGISLKEFEKPFSYNLLGGTIVELGKRRDAFSGTDALSMSVQPLVLAWLSKATSDVVGEGDRLCNNSFFLGAMAWAKLSLVHVSVPPGEADRRRKQRAATLGTKQQNETWLRGRQTKIRRILDSWICYEIDGTLPIDEQVQLLYKIPPFDRLEKLK